ncbi:MAG: tetratricopeptide repeat protein [Leptolyngbya sp. BL-A-14]
MALSLKLTRWFAASLLLSPLPSLLAVSYPHQRASAQTPTEQTRKAAAKELFQQGIQQFQTSQFQAALKSWQQALTIFKEIGDRQGEAASLGNLGLAYFSLGQYAIAIEFHQQSLAIECQIGDLPSPSSSLLKSA